MSFVAVVIEVTVAWLIAGVMVAVVHAYVLPDMEDK